MFDNPRRLLDQITLMHGPHDLLRQYFSLADATASDWGLRLRLRSDFAALVALNRDNPDTWPPLPPIFDPEHSNLRIDASFWLEGIDDRGDTVITEAARFFDFTDTNVVDELRSLRVHYENPAPHLAAGERIDIEAPMAMRVSGRTMHGGAIWVRPDWRRNGLTRVISRISAAYAHTRWNTAFTWGVVEPRLHAVGLSQAYGPHEVAEGVTYRLAWRGVRPMVLIWMRTEALLRDLAGAVDYAAMVPSERYAHDEPLTARPLPGQR